MSSLLELHQTLLLQTIQLNRQKIALNVSEQMYLSWLQIMRRGSTRSPDEWNWPNITPLLLWSWISHVFFLLTRLFSPLSVLGLVLLFSVDVLWVAVTRAVERIPQTSYVMRSLHTLHFAARALWTLSYWFTFPPTPFFSFSSAVLSLFALFLDRRSIMSTIYTNAT